MQALPGSGAPGMGIGVAVVGDVGAGALVGLAGADPPGGAVVGAAELEVATPALVVTAARSDVESLLHPVAARPAPTTRKPAIRTVGAKRGKRRRYPATSSRLRNSSSTWSRASLVG